MKNSKEKVFSIGEAARMSGCTVKKLRYWEAKGFIPEPQRVVCGDRCYRKFGEDDLEIIKRIASYLNDGFTLSASAKKAAEHIVKKEDENDA